ncbi:MAG: hypothetical protein Terrestrivirus1_100 [Terrestrivirus sp.]|uniref:Uncharacterized protein n=1 Tax=Terrestrivirus sp. TaxID=2487775 RepID=A0A3G4ZK70_9VIRU|nr:MAG: hypothetical protein Terrestrivirus1_100 [Terrestrivirus sp.]
MSQDSIKNAKVYHTHDNGGRPFKIEISPNKKSVNIYKLDDSNSDADTTSEEYNFALTFNPKKIFIGKSELNKMTEFSGGHGPEFDGNTILLELSDNVYEFIGDTIFSFTTLGKITKYESPVGNNDVPYPYAIDEYENIYLLIEDVILKHTNKLLSELSVYDNDPYSYYYNLNLMTADKGIIPPELPVVKNFEGIVDYYIGNNRYTLRYEPNPEKDFDRLRKMGKMYIVDSSGAKKELTKKMYISLMKKFGDKISVEKFKKTVDIERLW